MASWPLGLPLPSDPSWRRRAAAWVSHLLPGTVLTACPALTEHPRAAGRVAWVYWRAVQTARGRDERGPLSMSAAIPADLLAGLLPEDDVALVRALQVPVDTATSARAIERRLEDLAAVGPHLPTHFLSG
ncbi:hypothetical protein [Marinactinospora rubrisoli]|uniref:Uncharacterized protein n=1 Tax=Marinactinospora rubrisoli TaxID=2715399 RepID=A0ABW2KPM4_9ACTN